MLAALAGASVGLRAVSSYQESKKRNAALAARQAWLQEEKKYSKGMFELQTFQKYFSKDSAGAKRIAISAGMEGGIGGARVLSQYDDIFLQTDMALDKIRQRHTLARIDSGISQMERQKTSPGWSAFLGGLTGLIDAGVSGAFDPKTPKDDKKKKVV